MNRDAAPCASPTERSQPVRTAWWAAHDHRQLARRYGLLLALVLVAGAFLALGLALRPGAAEPARDPHVHRQLFSMHGASLVFFLTLPALPSVVSNWYLPELLGRTSMAWPRVNLLGFQLYVGALLLLAAAFAWAPGDAGWGLDLALSAQSSGALWLSRASLVLVCAALGCQALNAVATGVQALHEGFGLERWTLHALGSWLGSLLLLGATPCMALAFALAIALETGAAQELDRAQQLLLERTFWFGARAALGGLVVMALGWIAFVFDEHAAGRRAASALERGCLLTLALLACFGHGAHLAARELPPAELARAAAWNLSAGLPLALLASTWLRRMLTHPPLHSAALYHAFSAFALLLLAALSGALASLPPLRQYLEGSSFSTAQLHCLWLALGICAPLAAITHLWCSWSGTEPQSIPAQAGALSLAFGALLGFGPLFAQGYLGQPSRSSAAAMGPDSWRWIAAAGGLLVFAGLLATGWSLVGGASSSTTPEPRS